MPGMVGRPLLQFALQAAGMIGTAAVALAAACAQNDQEPILSSECLDRFSKYQPDDTFRSTLRLKIFEALPGGSAKMECSGLVTNAVAGLNKTFAPFNWGFMVDACETVPDDALNHLDPSAPGVSEKFPELLRGAVDLFFVDELVDSDELIWKTLTFPQCTLRAPVGVVEKADERTTPIRTAQTLGSLFGLLPTDCDRNGVEHIAREGEGANCEDRGDRLCSTGADPGPYDGYRGAWCDVECPDAVKCTTGPGGGEAYAPPIGNAMSPYECGDQFTDEQMNVMICNYETNLDCLDHIAKTE